MGHYESSAKRKTHRS
jgi:dsDNA-specific endonuclease/ATPase MutS2